jgi:hypothetical protein
MAEDWKSMAEELGENGPQLVAITQNLIDEVWEVVGGRPAITSNPLMVLDVKFAGW